MVLDTLDIHQRTFEIRDASLKDLVTELEALRKQGCEDIVRMRTLYNYLNESVMSEADARFVFRSFRFHLVRIGMLTVNTALHLRHLLSSITSRGMASQVGTRPLIACGPVRQQFVAKSSWMSAGRRTRVSL